MPPLTSFVRPKCCKIIFYYLWCCLQLHHALGSDYNHIFFSRLFKMLITSQTTYSCRNPACGNLTAGCVSHTQTIVQPYTFTCTIFNSGHNVYCLKLLPIYRPQEGWTPWMAGGCPENRTHVDRLHVWRVYHYDIFYLPRFRFLVQQICSEAFVRILTSMFFYCILPLERVHCFQTVRETLI